MTYKDIETMIFELDEYVKNKYHDKEITFKIVEIYRRLNEVKREQDCKLRNIRDIVNNLIM